jgi:hypothetical protein
MKSMPPSGPCTRCGGGAAQLLSVGSYPSYETLKRLFRQPALIDGEDHFKLAHPSRCRLGLPSDVQLAPKDQRQHQGAHLQDGSELCRLATILSAASRPLRVRHYLPEYVLGLNSVTSRCAGSFRRTCQAPWESARPLLIGSSGAVIHPRYDPSRSGSS